MIVELHNKFGNPQQIECTRLVVRDGKHGNPLVVVLEHSPGQLWTAQAGDEKFSRALRLMGIPDTLVVESLDDLSTPKTFSEQLLR